MSVSETSEQLAARLLRVVNSCMGNPALTYIMIAVPSQGDDLSLMKAEAFKDVVEALEWSIALLEKEPGMWHVSLRTRIIDKPLPFSD